MADDGGGTGDISSRFESETCAVEMLDGSLRPVTLMRATWENYELATGRAGYLHSKIVEWALEEEAETGLPFEKNFRRFVDWIVEGLRRREATPEFIAEAVAEEARKRKIIAEPFGGFLDLDSKDVQAMLKRMPEKAAKMREADMSEREISDWLALETRRCKHSEGPETIPVTLPKASWAACECLIAAEGDFTAYLGQVVCGAFEQQKETGQTFSEAFDSLVMHIDYLEGEVYGAYEIVGRPRPVITNRVVSRPQPDQWCAKTRSFMAGSKDRAGK